MKKNLLLFFMLSILSNCINPEQRSWIIPLTIDDSFLTYTPEQIESFQMRRAVVLNSMESGYLILKSSDQHSHNRHEFRTNNYFYYLTGYATSGSYLILSTNDTWQSSISESYSNIRMDIYDGAKTSARDILRDYQPDTVLTYVENKKLLADILKSGRPVYVDMKNRDLMDELKKLQDDASKSDFLDVAPILDELRVIKAPMEVARMQKAANITARALTNVMYKVQPDMYEYEMEAVIEGSYLKYGSAMPGFPSIVGSGPNSTTLHYEPNTRLMEDGDLLLMDVGADYGYYTADISRTIPVNGKFSPEQKAIYQLVLDAQKAAIAVMIPGNGVRSGHFAARAVMKEGLAELGLITDVDAEWQIQFYCIHGSSHYLGMDVHDVGDYYINPVITEEDSTGNLKYGRTLEPGMVLTIEPGIYIRKGGLDHLSEMFSRKADSTEIAAFVEAVKPLYEKYADTGVRIEDDVLISSDGNLVLSRYAPKEVEDIEQLMR